MGLLDSVLGRVLSGGGGTSGNGGQSGLIAALIGGLIQQAGGVGGLLRMLKVGGLGQHADSWQSTGQNMPVDGGDLLKVLGGMTAGGAMNQPPRPSGEEGAMGGIGGLLGQVLAGAGPGGTGGGSLADVLAQNGIGQDELGGLLAQVLPNVVDGMTPDGQVPQQHSNDMLSNVLGSVLGRAMGRGSNGGGLFG